MFPMAAVKSDVDLAPLWTRARERAGVKQDFLAWLMELPQPQLSDQIAGRGHLSVQRVLLLAKDEDGRRFLRYLAIELGEASGFDFDALLAITRIERLAAKLIDRIQKRVPAKADLREKREEEIA